MELKKTTGYYIGKVISSKGKRQDGSAFVKYKYMFKPTMESDKCFSMGRFVSAQEVSGDIQPVQSARPEMVEGKQYELQYTEKEGTYNNAPVVYKTIQNWIEISACQQAQATHTTKSDIKFKVPFSQFYPVYLDKMAGKEITLPHLIGSYLLSCLDDCVLKDGVEEMRRVMEGFMEAPKNA